MSTLYRIRDWNATYENAESRKYKHLTWLRLPIKLDGNGYKALMELEDSPSIFGCFVGLLECAGRLLERGTFTNSSGKPLTPKMIARAISQPEHLVERTLNVLSQGDFDWIEKIALDDEGRRLPEDSPGTPEDPGRLLELGSGRRTKAQEELGTFTERQAQEGGGEADARGAVDLLEPRGVLLPISGPPPDPISEITNALEEATGKTDSAAAEQLCRAAALEAIHPWLVRRWIDHKGTERKARGQPIREPKLFLQDWPKELPGWIKSNFAALNGGRYALMESPACGRCKVQQFRFEDGTIVRCKCTGKRAPGLVRG